MWIVSVRARYGFNLDILIMVVLWSSWKFTRSCKKQQLKRKRAARATRAARAAARKERSDRMRVLKKAVKQAARDMTQNIRLMSVASAAVDAAYLDIVSFNNQCIAHLSRLLFCLLQAFHENDWAKFDWVQESMLSPFARIPSEQAPPNTM